MKFNIAAISTILLAATVSTYAQTVSFIYPPSDSIVPAGLPFTVSLQFQNPITHVYVADLIFGQQSFDDPTNSTFGEVILANVASPVFDQIGPHGEPFVKNVTLTLPAGTAGQVNITCGEFYTIGVENAAFLHVTKTPVNVV